MRTHLLLVATATACLGAGSAAAADYVTLLDWACDPDANSIAYVKSSLLTACELTEGPKSACDVVSGTPFACFNNTSAAKTLDCDKGVLSFSLSGTVGGALGWKIEGTLNVRASYKYQFAGNQCDLTMKSPVPSPSAGGGTYVYRSGTATAKATFYASGTGYVTFLGGRLFGKDYSESCTKSMQVSGYRTSSTSGCQGPPSPSPSPTTSPDSSPDASPTFPPYPTDTPSPFPTNSPGYPDAGISPPPSPPDSPSPFPTVTSSPSPFPSSSPAGSPVGSPHGSPTASSSPVF